MHLHIIHADIHELLQVSSIARRQLDTWVIVRTRMTSTLRRFQGYLKSGANVRGSPSRLDCAGTDKLSRRAYTSSKKCSKTIANSW